MANLSGNPYFDPNEDADILNPSSSAYTPKGGKHVLDGSMCQCGTAHDLNLPPDIPQEVIEQLSEFLDKLPSRAVDVVVSSENSLAIKLLYDFVDFTDEIDAANASMPLMRAIAETVDSLAGGNVIGPKVRFFESEHMLISSHVVMKALDGIRNKLNNDFNGEDDPRRISLFEAFEAMLESGQIRLDNAINNYKQMAEETNNSVDPLVLEKGEYSPDASYFASRMFRFPVVNFANTDEKTIEAEDINNGTSE